MRASGVGGGRAWRGCSCAAVLIGALLAIGAGQSRAGNYAEAQPASAPRVAWSSGGPYTDDATAVAMSPAFDRDHTVFLGVAYDTDPGQPYGNATVAILRSTDSGTTWSTAWSHRTPADSSAMQGSLLQIAISPAFSRDGTVYALWTADSGGLLRSTDGGRSFQGVGTDLPAPAHSDVSGTLALSPQYGTDATVAVTMNSGNTTTSYLSLDGGTNWRPVVVGGGSGLCAVSGGGFLLPLGGGRLGSYLPAGNADCSNNQDTLFAVSADGGRSWVPEGDIQAAVRGQAFESQHSTLFATSDGRHLLYTDQYGTTAASGDGGRTWHDLSGTVLASYVSPLGSGHVAYTFSPAPSGDGVYAVQRWHKGAPHLYYSADGGGTWSVAWVGHGVTASYGAAVGTGVRFYAAGNAGLLRSIDAGRTWQSAGVYRPNAAAVAVSPAYVADRTAFSADLPADSTQEVPLDPNGYGIFASRDGGARWSMPVAADVRPGVLYSTAFHGTLSLAVSPAYTRDHTVWSGDWAGTVNVSRDSGATWTAVPISGQQAWSITALAASPRYAVDHTVYAGVSGLGVSGFGIARSTDGGRTWRQEVDPDQFEVISQAQTNDLSVAVGAHGVRDLAISMSGPLFLWQDAGDGRRPVWLSARQPGITRVTLSPNYARDCTIFAGVGPGKQVLGYTIEDGLYVSTNACPANLARHTDRWTWLRAGLSVAGRRVWDVTSIAVSPNFARDHSVFASSASLGVFESVDAGRRWTPINSGLGSLAVNRIALAATGRSGTLFAATQSGVWQATVPLGTAPRAEPGTVPTAAPTAAIVRTPSPTATATARAIVPVPSPTETVVASTPAPSLTVPPATATPARSACAATNLSGTWAFTANGATVAFRDGTATFQQAGSTLNGSLAQSDITWKISGSVQGQDLTLTFSAQGQVDQTYAFTIASSGATISGDPGVFSRGC